MFLQAWAKGHNARDKKMFSLRHFCNWLLKLQLAAALQTGPTNFAFFFGFSPNSSGIVLEAPSLVGLETLKKASFKEVEACINLEEG